jgi:5'(3')-deoxyribonucleotidase
MERIIIDMDEVIADPMGDMIAWYRKEFGLEVDYNKMLGGSWIRGFPEQHQELVRNRIMQEGFFRGLSVMKDSVDVLKEMNRHYELFIVSAATEFPNSLRDKLEWLLEHFPFLTWKQLTLCGDKRLVFGDYMIDDHVRNLKHFPGRKYLFTSAHNLDITEYDRINNWLEAGEIFLNNPGIQTNGQNK